MLKKGLFSSRLGCLFFPSAASLPTFYTLPPTPSLYVPPKTLFPVDSEVTERLQNISLIETEGKTIAPNPNRRTQTLVDCSLSLVGCFLMARDVNHRVAKNLLRSTLKLGNDLRIVDVGEGLYLFCFKLESQLQWV